MCLDKKSSTYWNLNWELLRSNTIKFLKQFLVCNESITPNVADDVSHPHRLDATIKLMYISLSPIYMAIVISIANCQYYKGNSEIQFLNVNEILQSTTFGLWGLTNFYHIIILLCCKSDVKIGSTSQLSSISTLTYYHNLKLLYIYTHFMI